MAKTIWAVDLGDWSLKVARGTYAKRTGTITVDLYDEIVYGTLPCGFEAGPLERQREGLIAFRQKYDIKAADDLCVSISGREVFHRFINLPPVPESIGDIIRYEARQQIPFDIDEVVWDYQTIKEEYELGEEIEVGLFALKRERVEELMDLLGPYCDNLRIIQDAPLAVYNFLQYEGRGHEPLVVADIGSGTTDLIVFNPPRFWLRTVLVAGDDLTQALMQKFDIHAAEAERVKRKSGASEHQARIMSMFAPVVDELTNEIQRSLGYYKSLAREARFSRILTVGNAMKLEGLRDLISRGLQYEIVGLDGLNRIQLGEGVNVEEFMTSLPGACAALGLLVQGAGHGRMHVNMVPEKVGLHNEMNKKKPALFIASLCLLLIVAVLAGTAMFNASALDAAAQEVGKFSGVVERAKSNNAAFDQKLTELNQLQSELRQATNPGIGRNLLENVNFLLARTLPEDEVLLRLLDVHWRPPTSVNAPSATTTTGRRTSTEFNPFSREGREERFSGRRFTDQAQGPLPSRREPLRGEDSVLVVTFEGETLWQDEARVRTDVFEALRDATWPGGTEPVFSQVIEWNIVRDDTTGVPMLVFRGMAVVDLTVPIPRSDETPTADAGAALTDDTTSPATER